MAKKGIETLVIASKAKGVLKKAGCNTAGDAFTALNGYLYWLLEQAAKRAKANGRKTVRKHDFMILRRGCRRRRPSGSPSRGLRRLDDRQAVAPGLELVPE